MSRRRPLRDIVLVPPPPGAMRNLSRGQRAMVRANLQLRDRELRAIIGYLRAAARWVAEAELDEVFHGHTFDVTAEAANAGVLDMLTSGKVCYFSLPGALVKLGQEAAS